MKQADEIITDHLKIDRDKWSEFILNHNQGNIFQTPEYFDLCRNSSRSDGIVICCLREGIITGILVAQIISSYEGLLGKLISRAIIMGGPLVIDENAEIAGSIITTYNVMVKNKVLYSQFRNLTDISFSSSKFKSAGYKYEDHLNFLVNLNSDPEQMWIEIHPVRRKQIRRSQNRGVSVEVLSYIDEADLLKCYKLLVKTYKRNNIPLQDIDYFRKAIQIFTKTGMLKIFAAKYMEEIIGFRIVLCYDKTIFDWYAASSGSHSDKYPNDILPWEIFLWGNKNGYKCFDFGGAGKPGIPYGVRDYKQKFGGELVNYGRYTCIHRKFFYMLALSGYTLQSKITRR